MHLSVCLCMCACCLFFCDFCTFSCEIHASVQKLCQCCIQVLVISSPSQPKNFFLPFKSLISSHPLPPFFPFFLTSLVILTFCLFATKREKRGTLMEKRHRGENVEEINDANETRRVKETLYGSACVLVCKTTISVL